MKLVLVSQEYPPETAKGGIGTQTDTKAHGLARLGFDVTVISRSLDSQRYEYTDDSVKVIRVPNTSMAIYTEPADWLTHSYAVAVELSALHSIKKIDLIDFPEWGCEGYIHLINQSPWNHIKTVIHLHGPLIMLSHTLGWPDINSQFYQTGIHMEKNCLQLADAIFTSSHCSVDWCVKHYGIDSDNIPRLHTGIDTNHFSPKNIAKSDRPTIIFVGKIVRNKGVELLFDAACILTKDFPDLLLKIYGGGKKEIINKLTKKEAERGLQGLLELPGYIGQQDLPEQLSQAHVFAAPSQYEGGPGFVYLEAMACGLPVIACKGSGAAEVVKDQYNGILVNPDDLDALTAALRELLADNNKREKMGNNARSFVLQEADSNVCINKIADYYQQILSKPRI